MKPIKKRIDYSEKKYKNNPLFRHKKKGSKNIPWQAKAIVVLIFSISLGTAWFLFCSEYFKIREIEVNGTGNINKDEVKTIAFSEADGTILRFLEANNIFLYNTKNLSEKIMSSYSLDELDIRKNFPNKIIIDFKQRKQTYVWQEAGRYYYIDSIGNIVYEASANDPDFKNFPLIENKGEACINGRIVDGRADFLFSVSSVIKKMDEKGGGNFKINRIVYENEKYTLKFLTDTGTTLLFNTQADIGKQVEKLVSVIQDKLKNDFKKKKYIDLRYGDMVYYQ